MPRPLPIVPLLVLAPGCAISVRAGPETKAMRGDVTAEAQATVAVGAAGDHAGEGLFFPAMTLSGGAFPSTNRGTGSFEAGGDYASTVATRVSLRLGPRIGAAWGGHYGGYVGLRGGAAFALSEPALDRSYSILLLEAFASPGLGGDLTNTVFYGAGLAVGFEDYASFRIPHGRPAREDGRAIVAPVAKRRAWREGARPETRGMRKALRETLGRAWLVDARDEHASVAVFAKLSLQLLACGAPPELVAGAHRAALDEVRHAKLCFGLAAAYLGEDVDPGPLPVAAAAPASLETIAAEALVDGVLGEGWAAHLAQARRRAARDPAVRGALGVIAREERRHARLAAEVFCWAVRRGGAPVREAVRAAWDLERHRVPAAGLELAAHGVATTPQIERALARARRDADALV